MFVHPYILNSVSEHNRNSNNKKLSLILYTNMEFSEWLLIPNLIDPSDAKKVSQNKSFSTVERLIPCFRVCAFQFYDIYLISHKNGP